MMGGVSTGCVHRVYFRLEETRPTSLYRDMYIYYIINSVASYMLR